jgi:hypothetical protein
MASLFPAMNRWAGKKVRANHRWFDSGWIAGHFCDFSIPITGI